MQLHQLQPKHTPKDKKPRVGRGGKRGTTSGHGTKGQKSRSGRRIRPAERDLIQRLPKLRGAGQLLGKREKVRVINVGDLEKLAKDGVISREIVGNVKILGDGEVKSALTVKNLKFSKTAKQKIEAAGGKAE